MSDERRIRAAAQARGRSVIQRSDRPRSRRAAPGSESTAATVKANFTTRQASNGTGITFEGIASAYESPYEMFDSFGPYFEVVSAGAGARTLARSDLDVPLVLDHTSLRRIARTSNGSLTLSESPQGLNVYAPNLDPADADVAYIVPKIQAGLIDEMSFAFRIVRGVWSPDFSEYRIQEYDLQRGDVAIVGYGANPSTTATLRHQTGADLIRMEETTLIPFV